MKLIISTTTQMNELECLFSLQPSKNFSLHSTTHIIRVPMPPRLAPTSTFSPSFLLPAPPFQSFSIFHHVISKSHATPFPVNVEFFLFSSILLLTRWCLVGELETHKSHTRNFAGAALSSFVCLVRKMKM